LHCLDALRTVAALAVVLEHWPQHFFSVKAFAQPLAAAPLYAYLSLPYRYGASAVTFFFCLSGFIFFWLYAEEVHGRKLGFRDFAMLRVSRLYPLHLATLSLLVPLVALMWVLFGSNFVYANDDLYHFALNLLGVQYWGFQHGYSWNGPSWSVSVEIALYIIFFIACRLSRPGLAQAACLAIVALVCARFSIIIDSAVAFFVGGMTYYAYRWAARHGRAWHAATAVAATVLLWLWLAPLSDRGVGQSTVAQLRSALPAGLARDLAGRAALVFCDRLRDVVLFPSVIFSFAFLESRTQNLPWRRLSGVGNLSYGVYLIHYPLQFVAVLAALSFSAKADFFTRPSVLVVFLVVLLAAAAASYQWFEKPAMLALRRAARQRERAPALEAALAHAGQMPAIGLPAEPGGPEEATRR
jgi:peptidoglycan/LPS O-acetylase OafA/YrhL